MLTRLDEKSHIMGAPFEKALTEVLEYMGFVAARDGAPGEKDVIVVAPAGDDDTFRCTFETKALTDPESKGINNKTAHIAGASSHAKKANAEFAVLVVRKFAGFDSSDFPAIMEECRCQDPPVSIMTVEAISELARVVWRHQYPLTSLKAVFRDLETPDEKLQRIKDMDTPMEQVDVRALLDEVYRIQKDESDGGFVGVPQLVNRLVRESTRFKDVGVKDRAHLERVLSALTVLVDPLVVVKGESVYLTQHPEVIAERFARALDQTDTAP